MPGRKGEKMLDYDYECGTESYYNPLTDTYVEYGHSQGSTTVIISKNKEIRDKEKESEE